MNTFLRFYNVAGERKDHFDLLAMFSLASSRRLALWLRWIHRRIQAMYRQAAGGPRRAVGEGAVRAPTHGITTTATDAAYVSGRGSTGKSRRARA
jgi:hypothetical protein